MGHGQPGTACSKKDRAHEDGVTYKPTNAKEMMTFFQRFPGGLTPRAAQEVRCWFMSSLTLQGSF